MTAAGFNAVAVESKYTKSGRCVKIGKSFFIFLISSMSVF